MSNDDFERFCERLARLSEMKDTAARWELRPDGKIKSERYGCPYLAVGFDHPRPYSREDIFLAADNHPRAHPIVRRKLLNACGLDAPA